MKSIKNYSFQIFSLFLFLLINIFFTQQLQRLDLFIFYIFFLIIYVAILYKFIKFPNTDIHESEPKISLNILCLLIYLPVVFITQNYDLNFEQITWDVASYLVASQDIGLGYIPFESSWESKGPLNYYVYHFLNLISFKSYIHFRLINDLVILVIGLLIFNIINEKNNSFLVSFTSGLFFIGLVSKNWYVSEFSEIYCIFILALCIKLKEKNSAKYIVTISLLLSVNSLINQGSIIFIIPFFWWIVSKNLQEKNYKETSYFLTFLALPQIIVMSIYYASGLLDIYLANYITIPLKYSGKSQSTFRELFIWLKDFHAYSYFLVIALLVIFIIIALENLTAIKNLFNDFYFQSLIISILYYFVGSHNFYHHLFYLVFFVCFFIYKIQSKDFKVLIMSLIIIGTCVITYNMLEKSYNNLKDLEATQNNYPLYKLSEEIDSYFLDKSYSILAIDYVLVLHYLEKQNYSYIIHPTNHFEDYIKDTLIELGYLNKNNLINLINQGPDVILCNDTLNIRGQKTIFSEFKCEELEKLDNYIRIETGKYYHDWNIELYKDRSKKMFVLIKNSK
tara:strand:+ start:1815 stop:3506 length:1692 start_codon:yes stop_codon:yes gene_type:complete